MSFARFREITDYQGDIYIDSKYDVYKALGCKEKGDSVWKSISHSVFGKSSKFIMTGNLEGNLDQQGGEFVLNSEGVILYSYNDSFAGEFKDYKGILESLSKIPR
eukprot:TRINITY_DN2438_c0_g1_i1.p1 TRINITY_DN2438_c0_g1~~TRINITY_DN2438_c0_g1_i1.p1  ORF type:complete len:105 (-),score=21.46 TRINITY_DN2438_c0_g1_i1:126-440(-)